MYKLLDNLRVIEGASFVAAPSCALHLQQMGAEVIRFDDMSKSPDRGRWPLAAGGDSLYWEGLNKGKKSVALDLSRKEGRELAIALIAAPGDGGGLFVTNYPAAGFLAHERLAALRPDLITLRVMGWPDGKQAVDYTVNAALGIPLMTGPAALGDAPVNHVLPAWDLLTGAYGAFALLAAESHRRRTGVGQEVRVPLGDIALAALSNLGQVAEVTTSGKDRPRYGNDIFGAFGRDFTTADGRRIMLAAITPRQWSGLIETLGIGEAVAALESERGVSFAQDEGMRFTHRDALVPMVAEAIAARTLAELAAGFDQSGMCWEPYRTLGEAIAGGALARSPGLFGDVRHPSGETYPTAAAAAQFGGEPRAAATPAPRLGQHTEQVLSGVLGLSSAEIGRLADQKLVLCA